MVEAGTLCINADVEKFSGANGSATSGDEAYTNVYIKEAEGIVSGLSRYDYVTNYALLTAIAKEFLRKATATLAAIDVIKFDISGYTTRIEAEDMLNILYSEWRSFAKTLSDQKFVTWAQT